MRSAAVICGIFLSSLLLGSVALAAQHIPGGGARDLRERSQRLAAEYRRGILADISREMIDWQDAWEDDDPRAMARLYAEDAIIIRPSSGAAYRGQQEIERFFAELLSTAGAISTDVLDLGAGDRMAYAVARYTSAPSMGVGGAGVRRGTLVTVFQLDGSNWRIRSQTFLEGS